MRLTPSHRPSLVLTCALGVLYAAVAMLLPASSHAGNAAPAVALALAPATAANIAFASQDTFRGDQR